MTPYRVALLGLGTVGREVARLLTERAPEIGDRAGGRRLELVGVSVRDSRRLVGMQLPAGTIATTDPHALTDNEDVDVLVEVMGGVDAAGELVTAALENGKPVVTANKALLARHGAALERLSREKVAPLRFEASVMGPTPVLSVLAEDLVAMEVTRIRGVVNGTTNWILDAIEHEGMSADEALAKAQSFGYTEADPSLDTEARAERASRASLPRRCRRRRIAASGSVLSAR
jgi:homoserine dehydrogenase